MILSDTVSKIGMAMAYYGTFGALGSGAGLFLSKGGHEAAGIGVVVLALGLAYVVKRVFHIKFIGPSGN